MRKKEILIVDDEADVTRSIKQGLEYMNSEYEIVTANSGGECLKLLKKGEHPDLILLDIMMPGMSGWMVSDRLRENKKWDKIPLVFLTARTDNFAKEVANPLCSDYIKKPFDIIKLRKKIDRLINKNTEKDK